MGQLLESITSDKSALRDLENKSLSLLQKAEGHILDDQVLIDTLQQSKVMSKEIQQRIEASEVNEKKITAARKKYLPMATRGAVLYFVVAELAQLDYMYQFSLDWFMKLFTESISEIYKPHLKKPLSELTQQQIAAKRGGFSSMSRYLAEPTTEKMMISFSFSEQLYKMITILT
uniref:Dynein heavy chain ATP-binding dynein motor region domain-containing protein n=4 Tax=Callorhinchus milii TaxID=7868 RepID=A0A4W3JPK3_CALMI